MHVQFSAEFDKQFNSRLTRRQKLQVLETLDTFIDNPDNKDLRNHALGKEWQGYRSISRGADLRLHFKMINNGFAYFVAVGTHKQLYK